MNTQGYGDKFKSMTRKTAVERIRQRKFEEWCQREHVSAFTDKTLLYEAFEQGVWQGIDEECSLPSYEDKLADEIRQVEIENGIDPE